MSSVLPGYKSEPDVRTFGGDQRGAEPKDPGGMLPSLPHRSGSSRPATSAMGGGRGLGTAGPELPPYSRFGAAGASRRGGLGSSGGGGGSRGGGSVVGTRESPLGHHDGRLRRAQTRLSRQRAPPSSALRSSLIFVAHLWFTLGGVSSRRLRRRRACTRATASTACRRRAEAAPPRTRDRTRDRTPEPDHPWVLLFHAQP